MLGVSRARACARPLARRQRGVARRCRAQFGLQVYDDETARRLTLVALELSGYLERYLWPLLGDPASGSWEHIMSIVALVNLKAREGASPWAAFSDDAERFAALFARVLELPNEQPRWLAAGYDARASWTAFFVNAFAALEDAMVRAQALKLVSLPMWSTLAPKQMSLFSFSRRVTLTPPSPSRRNAQVFVPLLVDDLANTFAWSRHSTARPLLCVPLCCALHEREELCRQPWLRHEANQALDRKQCITIPPISFHPCAL